MCLLYSAVVYSSTVLKSDPRMSGSKRKSSGDVEGMTIPYVGTISEQLEPGSLIVIRGRVPSHAERFQVDLQCGSSTKPRADVAFHFNPRFKRANYIVCNTLTNERWGWEEITYDMPFQKEKSFEIAIMVLKDKFQVAVNGKHTLLYAHRIKLEKIDTLGIYDHVNVHSVGFRFSSDLQSTQASTLGLTNINRENVQKSGISQFFTGTQSAPVFFGQFSHEVPSSSFMVLTVASFQTLPFEARLNSPMGPGRTVVIKGEVNTKAKSGHFHDYCQDKDPVCCFAFKFVPQSGLWAHEQPCCAAPYLSTEAFRVPRSTMIIYCDARDFKVAINGAHSLEYKHRFLDLGSIDTVAINGDIHLLEVRSW
ncbi:Galectin-8 [Heterocephalus glaber]|uniref:Galectin n=1 Tax=Heterocephalus glaber TaxID=10181 RepID=G5APM5_HETGA|nr:Galectin-8 [Heterocephalus glaber]